MVEKYFLIRISKNFGDDNMLQAPCWIPSQKKYDTPEEAEKMKKGYSDPENFIIMSCYVKDK